MSIKEKIRYLKPCPFCNGVPALLTDDYDIINYKVECQKCFSSCYWTRYKKVAIKNWNRRSQPPAEKGAEE